MMLRLMFVTGCGVLLLGMCGYVEGQTTQTSKAKYAVVATIDHEAPPSETPEQSPNANAGAAPPASPDPRWEFSVAPYFFLAGLDGTVGVAGQSAQISASFRDVFRNLDFAAMGTVEAHKGNWSILCDVMYVSLSGKKVTPSPFFSDIKVEVKETLVEPSIAYRIVKREGGTIDLLAGVRFWDVNTHLTFEPGILPLVDVEDGKKWADPIVGAVGIANLSPRVFLMGRFDVGGFGLASDFTGRAFGGVGLHVKPRIALIGGYRYLRADYFSEGFIFKAAMSGIVLGARFKL